MKLFNKKVLKKIKLSIKYKYKNKINFPLVAKLDIAADSDSEGQGFKSLGAGQLPEQSTLCSAFLFLAWKIAFPAIIFAAFVL